MFELMDQLGHMEQQRDLRRKGEELAAKLMEDEKDVSPWPADFMRFAVPAFVGMAADIDTALRSTPGGIGKQHAIRLKHPRPQ